MGDLARVVVVFILLVVAVKSGILDSLSSGSPDPTIPSRTSTTVPDSNWPTVCKDTWQELSRMGINMEGWRCDTDLAPALTPPLHIQGSSDVGHPA